MLSITTHKPCHSNTWPSCIPWMTYAYAADWQHNQHAQNPAQVHTVLRRIATSFLLAESRWCLHQPCVTYTNSVHVKELAQPVHLANTFTSLTASSKSVYICWYLWQTVHGGCYQRLPALLQVDLIHWHQHQQQRHLNNVMCVTKKASWVHGRVVQRNFFLTYTNAHQLIYFMSCCETSVQNFRFF